MKRQTILDLKNFKLSKLKEKEYKHLWLLLYWIPYLLAFGALERIFIAPYYKPMYSHLDDLIPFCEFFIFPYLIWFFFIAGATIYFMLYDVPAFKKTYWFIIITFTISILIFCFYPTCQELRPTEFVRDNFITRFMVGWYKFDTNTNVFPSVHCMGALAISFGLHNAKSVKLGGKIMGWIVGILICVSTVFLKQHSIIDAIGGVVISIVVYVIVFVFLKNKATGKVFDVKLGKIVEE